LEYPQFVLSSTFPVSPATTHQFAPVRSLEKGDGFISARSLFSELKINLSPFFFFRRPLFLACAADDSARRLRITGSCRADSGNVSSPASTASLGNAGTVELAATAGRTVFDIRAGIIADQAALRALQRHVLEFCPKVSTQKE
jgi:hypothetical protein